MQDSRAGSTLELVVNEQQLQNMSQIDLSGQGSGANNNLHEEPDGGLCGFRALRDWPGQFRDSLGAKLDEAKAKSETNTQYAFELVRAFSGLIMWLLCFLCTIILPILLLFVGLLNLDNCTASPSLPYYVFTIGFIMTASNLFNLALALDLPILTNHRLLAADIKSIIASILNIIFNTAVAFVYVLTAYKVFTFSPQQSADETPVEGDSAAASPLSTCSQTLSSVAFWFITLTLSLCVVFGALGGLLFAYNRYRLAIIRGSALRSQSQQTNGGPANMSPSNLTSTNRL